MVNKMADQHDERFDTMQEKLDAILHLLQTINSAAFLTGAQPARKAVADAAAAASSSNRSTNASPPLVVPNRGARRDVFWPPPADEADPLALFGMPPPPRPAKEQPDPAPSMHL